MPYLAEFFGTMILILLGDGVVANVNLNRSGMKGAGAVQITFAWGLAVMLPPCGSISSVVADGRRRALPAGHGAAFSLENASAIT